MTETATITEPMQIKYAPALQKPQEIIFNFDELKAQIIEKREKYMNLVVSEDAIQEAKATKAELNRLEKMLDDERKTKKNWCLEPYKKVEPLYNELCDLIKEPVKAIDEQIKKFKNKDKDEKRAEIEKIYNENIGPLEKLVPLSSLYSSQWENKTFTLKKVETEIIASVKKIGADLDAINALDSKFVVEVKETYLAGFDLSAALQKGKRLEEREKELEELKQKAEIVKAAEAQAPKVEEKPKETKSFVGYSADAPRMYKKTFTVEATRDQLIKLNECLSTNNIKFTVE